MWIARLGQYLSIILTIFVMVVYILIDNEVASRAESFQEEVAEDPDKYSKPAQDARVLETTVYAYLNSFAYSFILICLNQLNGTLSRSINDEENH